MGFCSQIYVLDLNSLLWRKLFQKRFPDPRENPIFIANNQIQSAYFLGGVDHEKVFSLANFYICDLKKAIADLSQIQAKDEQVQIEIDWQKNHFEIVAEVCIWDDSSWSSVLWNFGNNGPVGLFEEGLDCPGIRFRVRRRKERIVHFRGAFPEQGTDQQFPRLQLRHQKHQKTGSVFQKPANYPPAAVSGEFVLRL